ncbi:MAG: sensor histidine kinase [Streptosporangiales bacterium]|nr:sensor histidine kinase [Streptosporangiales bacterium]
MGTVIRRLAVLRGVPAPVVDVAVAAAMAVAVCVAIAVASEPHSRAPDVFAYLLGVATAAVLVVRRRCPLGVLLAAAVLLFAYYAARYPGIQPVVPLSVPLYTAAVRGHLRWCAGVAGCYVVAAVVVVGFRLHEIAGLLTVIPQDAALLVVVILLGEVVRSRRVRLAEAADRLAEVEAQRDRDAARRVAEERLHIAREVHDIVGHSVSAIAVHAGLAADVLDDHPDRARESLGVVRAAARDAMAELKATVSLLRADAPGEPPALRHGLAELAALASLAGRPGLEVTTRVVGTPRPLPGVVDLSAFRVVQESLTNVVRHAGAGHADVTVRYGPDELRVEVADDGHGPDGVGFAPGHGIAGMAERVAALGGTFRTGRSEQGGFLVQASLPLDGAR